MARPVVLTKKKKETRGSITPSRACTCRAEAQRYQHIKNLTPKYWRYHKNYTSDWFEELQDETMVEYMFRGHAMKRAPKREYYVPGEEPPVYKWGQQKIHYPWY